MKRILGLLLAVFFLMPAVVQAEGLEVVAPAGPIFPPTEVWYPGRSVGGQGEKWVQLKNNEKTTSQVEVQVGDNNFDTSAQDKLSRQIFLTIYKLKNGTSSCLYGCGSDTKTLWDLYDAGGTKLPFDEFNLAPAAMGKLYFSATMDPQAGNKYQGRAVSFSLLFGSILPTPTPAANSAAVATAANVDGGGTTAAACNDAAPAAPANLMAAPAGIGQILLSWQAAAEPVDHYSLVYGLRPGGYLYGNLDIGKTTNYVVSGLTPGRRYYFTVAAVHGCATGAYSNEATGLSGGALGAVRGAEKPAAGFHVLGKKTPEGKVAGGQKNDPARPSGKKGMPPIARYWPLPLAAGAGAFLWWLRRRH